MIWDDDPYIQYGVHTWQRIATLMHVPRKGVTIERLAELSGIHPYRVEQLCDLYIRVPAMQRERLMIPHLELLEQAA